MSITRPGDCRVRDDSTGPSRYMSGEPGTHHGRMVLNRDALVHCACADQMSEAVPRFS